MRRAVQHEYHGVVSRIDLLFQCLGCQRNRAERRYHVSHRHVFHEPHTIFRYFHGWCRSFLFVHSKLDFFLLLSISCLWFFLLSAAKPGFELSFFSHSSSFIIQARFLGKRIHLLNFYKKKTWNRYLILN